MNKEVIPYGRQEISEEDKAAVLAVLESDFLTQGPAVPQFEMALAKYCGSTYATAVSSATAALHLSLLALGVGKGDLVWTSPITFAATSNAVLLCGADVDFIDIELDTFNLDLDLLGQRLRINRNSGLPLPKVVIPVHLGGLSVDMRTLRDLSIDYGFKILEDASHAIGGRFNGDRVGSCKYSDVAVFSFHPVKIITTGEGGAILTRDENIHRRVGLLRSHGITREPNLMERPPDGPWYYEQLDLGLNYRMTDLQASLGCSQLHRVDRFVQKRNAWAQKYRTNLEMLPLSFQNVGPKYLSSYHLFIVHFQESQNLETLSQLHSSMRSEGIFVNLHYIPVYRHPYYSRTKFSPCPKAEVYYRGAMSLPIFPSLSEENLAKICGTLTKVMGEHL